jgi:hypothetical protein
MTRDPDRPLAPQPPPEELEADARFPSGPWEGFWLQPVLDKNRHWMELILTFRTGAITGEGRDRVGKFVIRGRYDTDDGSCYWSKRYLGKHDVFYQGYNEGRGIWGTWELKDPPWRGGFHIWPVGLGDPTQRRTAAEADAPTEPAFDPTDAEPVGAGAGEESYDQGLGI